MNSKISFIAIALMAALSTACGHASFQAGARSPNPDGSGTGYSVSGNSYNPEAMVATLSNANVQETNTQQYWRAVQQGRVSPYMGGMTGDFRQYYCPGGVCLQSAPMTVAPASAQPGAKANDVSRTEFDDTAKTANEANRKATAAVEVLKNLRNQGKLDK